MWAQAARTLADVQSRNVAIARENLAMQGSIDEARNQVGDSSVCVGAFEPGQRDEAGNQVCVCVRARALARSHVLPPAGSVHCACAVSSCGGVKSARFTHTCVHVCVHCTL